MKLLLTSTGVTNKSIHNTLGELIGKPTKDSIVAFIPTSAYGETGDKEWLVDEMKMCHDLGWNKFAVVELTALSKQEIKERLAEADVIHMNGGAPYFLMNIIIEHDLEGVLRELLQTRVYVGSSAGSIVTTNRSPLDQARAYGEEAEYNQTPVEHYLGYVNFTLKTHINAPDFPGRSMQWAEKIAKKLGTPFYALDDNSALKIVDGKVQVVSEGDWKKFN